VNASWLVALGSREGAAGGRSREPLAPPPMRPMSLRGNPYLTYSTLEACAADIAKRCGDCTKSGACDDKPALVSFSDVKSECAFLTADPMRPTELCAAALLSIGTVKGCMDAAAPSCPAVGQVSNKEQLSFADAFLAEPACIKALDTCLSGGPPDTSGSSGGVTLINVDTSHCSDPFTACASSFKSLGDACKSGSCSGTQGQSCTSCSKSTGSGSSSSCSSCSKSSSSSSSSSSSGSSCGSKACKCETAPVPQAPIGDAAWLMAPLGYLFLRARRRA
jgi:hypothetical protein